jgi:hypothetical protein
LFPLSIGRNTCTPEPSARKPVTYLRPQELSLGFVPYVLESSTQNRATNASTAARCTSSPLSSCGYGIVMLPRSHTALMREPRVLVADIYRVWMACIWVSVSNCGKGIRFLES